MMNEMQVQAIIGRLETLQKATDQRQELLAKQNELLERQNALEEERNNLLRLIVHVSACIAETIVPAGVMQGIDILLDDSGLMNPRSTN